MGNMRTKPWWIVALVLLAIGTLLASCAPATPSPTATAAAKSAAAPSPTAAAPAAKTAAPTPTAIPATPTAAAAKPTPTPQPVTLKTGVVHATGLSGLYYAIEKGYFSELGITVEMAGITTLNDAIAATATGELQIVNGGVAAGMFNVFRRGVDAKMISGGSIHASGTGYGTWLLRKDLAGEIKEWSDVKGRKIATTGKGSFGHMALDKALVKAGLTYADVEHVGMGFPDMITALANKSVDIAFGIEPFQVRGVQEGVAVRWKPIPDSVPDYTAGIFVASPQLLKDQRDVANRFMVAYLRGTRVYLDAFFKNKGDKEGVIAALVKYTSVKDRSVIDQMNHAAVFANGEVDVKNLYEQMDWYIKAGFVEARVNLEPFVDSGPSDYAVKTLGKYQ